MHCSLMGTMRLPFIDSDLLYRVALSGRFDCIVIIPFMKKINQFVYIFADFCIYWKTSLLYYSLAIDTISIPLTSWKLELILIKCLVVLQPDTQFDGFNVLKEDMAKLYIVGKRKTNGIRIHLSSK